MMPLSMVKPRESDPAGIIIGKSGMMYKEIIPLKKTLTYTLLGYKMHY